jgi:hypothetical protein
MGPEVAKQYVQLVRDEAELKRQKRDLGELEKHRETILALARTAAIESPSAAEDSAESLKESMIDMFKLLLSAPANDNFQARNKAEKVGTSRYRVINVTGFGHMEVAGLGGFALTPNRATAQYRLAVVGLPMGYSTPFSLENSPVLVEFTDWDIVPEAKATVDVDKLNDENGTLVAVCQAAGLIEPDQTS